MKLKKLLQGTVFAAVAAVCMMAGTVTASAADGDLTDAGITSVKINADGTMEVTKSSGAEVMVGVASVSSKGVAKVASWDVYDGTGAQKVDLSKLSNVKDNYIAVQSDQGKHPAFIKIPARSKTIKVALDAETSTLKVGANATPEAVKADLYEYRTVYGKWTDLYASNASADMSMYQKQGATIYVREKGAEQASVSTQSTDKVTYGTTEIAVYNATAKLPGKEGKVNIAGAAKGPSVAVDYVKATVTLPQKSEYRLVTGTTVPTSNTANASKTTETVAKLIGTNDSATLEVRTAATDKKGASKWTSVKLTKAKEIDSGLITKGNTAATALVASNINKGETKTYGGTATDGIAAAKVKEGEKTVITITYGAKNSIVIKNEGALDYEFACSKAEATKPDSSAVVKKVAAGKTVTIKGWTDADYVFVRVAGNKKTTTFVGDFTQLGKIDFAKTVVGTKES